MKCNVVKARSRLHGNGELLSEAMHFWTAYQSFTIHSERDCVYYQVYINCLSRDSNFHYLPTLNIPNIGTQNVITWSIHDRWQLVRGC